jgi:hypothetical protein
MPLSRAFAIVLLVALMLGSLGSVDAGKRQKRDHEEHRTGISIEGGPIIADTHDGVHAAMWENPMRFTESTIPVYLYVDDVVFARQKAAFDNLASYRYNPKHSSRRSAGIHLPRFVLYQLPMQSCEWVDADRANKPAQSISVCQRDEFGWWGYVTMWYSKWPDQLGRVMVQLRTDKAQTVQGLHCHEMMHAVGGVLDDYGADPDGSCIYGDLSYLGPSDVAFLKWNYSRLDGAPQLPSGSDGVPQLSSGVGVQIDQSPPHKKRKKRR